MRTTELIPERHNWHTLARAVANVAERHDYATESVYTESLGSALLIPFSLELVCDLADDDKVDALTLVEYLVRVMPVYVIARCYDNGQCELWLYNTITDATEAWNRLDLNVEYDLTFTYTAPSSEHTVAFKYDSRTNSGFLVSSMGNTQFIQGDDASELADKLELLPTEDLVLLELSAYDTLWCENG